MTGRGRRELTDDDRIVWGQVARTVTPLPGRTAPAEPARPAREPQKVATASNAAVPAPVSAPRPASPPTPRGIDRPDRQKLAKGRLPIEARIDLHGMRQDQAHRLLLSFLSQARSLGMRHVLIITGKGTSFGSEGVLQRAVPEWLRTPQFRALVGAYDGAVRHHGGEGALYVRLRKPGVAS